jgi:hypothetical protein
MKYYSFSFFQSHPLMVHSMYLCIGGIGTSDTSVRFYSILTTLKMFSLLVFLHLKSWFCMRFREKPSPSTDTFHNCSSTSSKSSKKYSTYTMYVYVLRTKRKWEATKQPRKIEKIKNIHKKLLILGKLWTREIYFTYMNFM